MAIKRNLKLKKPQLRKPSTAPIDAVRNPNFPAALAQQDYQNLMRDQQARLAAGQGQGGAPLTQSEIDKKYVDDGRGGRVLNSVDAAKVKSQFDQLRANIAANQGPARNFDIDYIEGGQRNAPGLMPIGQFSPEQMQNLSPERRMALEQRMGVQQMNVQQSTNSTAGYAQLDPNRAGYMPVDPNTNMPSLMPIQTPGSNALNQDLANRGMGGGIPTPIPQGQQGAMASQYTNPAMNQMADYNKMLNKGMQRNQDMNQAAQNLAAPAGPVRSFSQVVGGINRMNRAPKPPRNRSLAPSNQKLI